MISFSALRTAAGFAPGALRARRSATGTKCHPIVEGHTTAPGIDAAIEIIRDQHGVPHVFAQTEADALFGQGYVHAQDRLFQLESMRRVAAGRIAELAGAPLVESDRFMRRVGLNRRAAADVEAAQPSDLVLLEAYARGVNAGVEALPALPPEFELLGAEPEPWAPADSMLMGRLLMFSFAANWDSELLRERLLEALGADRAALLDPAYGAHRATHTGHPYPGSADRLLQAYHGAQRAGLPAGVASNAWAVGPRRSASGRPLLAADPHVETRLPSLFHVSHLRGGAFDAIGADVAGIPGIAVGHTQRLAWGLTAGLADVADCFVETVDPSDPDRYATPRGWVRAVRRVERIEVRGGDPIDEVVLETRHGPVIEPAEPGADRAIALRCTALEPGDLAGPLLGLMRAESVADLEQAIDGWHGATFGFVYAHVDGTIGQRLAGSVPRRTAGEGLLPADGSASPGPSPTRPSHELPSVVDPAQGFVVAANNAPGADPTLGEEWCEAWRAERITALLEERPRHDVASFEAIQVDQRSEALIALRDHMVRRVELEPFELAILGEWDGTLAAESAGAALLETTYRELARDIAERIGGCPGSEVIGAVLPGGAPQTSFDYRMQGWTLDQVERPRPPAFANGEECGRTLRGALTRAIEELSVTQGDEPGHWSWGAAHQLRFDHALGSVPVAGGSFSRRPRPVGGDVNSVWQASNAIAPEREGRSVGPAYRQVIDLADFDRSTFQLSTGVSGIPGHPRYDDCIDEFLAGHTRPLLYTRPAIEAAADTTLLIEPAPAA